MYSFGLEDDVYVIGGTVDAELPRGDISFTLSGTATSPALERLAGYRAALNGEEATA